MVRVFNNKKKGSVKVEENPNVKIEEEPMDDDINEGKQKVSVSNDKKKLKHNKIIIRNLIVDINDKLIRKLCSPFGEITDIQIPMHELKKCSRGFAFVEYAHKNMCLKAIKQLNSTNYKGRTIIVDLAVSKQKFQEFKETQQKEIKMEQEPAIEPEADQNQDPPINDKNEKQQKPKSKKQKKEVKKEEATQKKIPQQKQPQDLSNSIFIRNVASTITQKDLYNFAKRFGKIKFAKVVIDPETKQCRGSAFVKFIDSEPAQRLIQYSRLYEQSQVPNSKVHFRQDPEINLDLQGRIIKIFPAQSRQQLASKLDTRQNKQKKITKPLHKIKNLEQLIEAHKGSKRNLQFALLGCYKSQPWMKRQDVQKFQFHEAQKLQKLKNPNNRVSQTRIALKYLPKQMTQENLKSVVYTFLRQKYFKQKNSLTWCKLMLDAQRKKSTGVAFIEFSKSNISTDFLKWLQESKKDVFQNANVLFEFAIQDARKMAKFNKSAPRKQQTQEQRPRFKGNRGNQNKDKPKGNNNNNFKKGKKIFKKK